MFFLNHENCQELLILTKMDKIEKITHNDITVEIYYMINIKKSSIKIEHGKEFYLKTLKKIKNSNTTETFTM